MNTREYREQTGNDVHCTECGKGTDPELGTCEHCGAYVDWTCECGSSEVEHEHREIYEWWAVDRRLFEHLQQLWQPVYDAGSCLCWGRCTTGQAILLDHVIAQVAIDMEILKGQRYDWSPKPEKPEPDEEPKGDWWQCPNCGSIDLDVTVITLARLIQTVGQESNEFETDIFDGTDGSQE